MAPVPELFRFLRVAVPMPKHANARPAARAFLAAERQGRADDMAEALFTTEDLSAGGCLRLAEGLGLDLEAYDRVVNDPATDAQLNRTVAWVQPAAPRGLPVLWVQEEKLSGAQPPDALRAALGRARPLPPSP